MFWQYIVRKHLDMPILYLPASSMSFLTKTCSIRKNLVYLDNLTPKYEESTKLTTVYHPYTIYPHNVPVGLDENEWPLKTKLFEFPIPLIFDFKNKPIKDISPLSTIVKITIK